MQPFSSISTLTKDCIINLNQLGYYQMTPIQQTTIPIIIQGKDLIAQAKTGSGKTAAFGIPIVASIDPVCKDPQVLVITPTRELAQQVTKELRKLARYRKNIKVVSLVGGVPMRVQISSLANGAHILVGTPGRLQDHLSKGTLPLHEIKKFVLDEGDKMLDMGFMDVILKISSNLPKRRQSMLFSATFPDKIERLSSTVLSSPCRITVDKKHLAKSIRQIAYEAKDDKKKILKQILAAYQPNSALIFCNTKADVHSLESWLYDLKFDASALTGDMDQRARNEALLMFANGSISLLAATDIASRGLDIDGVELVVNYDLPHDLDTYTHRIGRTGRSDAKGTAVSIYNIEQKEKLEQFSADIEFAEHNSLPNNSDFVMRSNMDTLCIDGGKKEKLRAGDILGVLCKCIGIDNLQIGKIDILDSRSYVGINKEVSKKALEGICSNKIKNKKFRAWLL